MNHPATHIAGTTTIKATCSQCKHRHEITVPTSAYRAWRSGTLIQRAFPELDADTRELLISGICGKCFDHLFGE